MNVQKISSVNNTMFGAGSVKPAEQEPVKKEIPDGKKKIALALAGLGALAVAAVGITAAVRKGKGLDAAGAANKIPGVNFDKGIATSSETGEKITGTIKHNLNNGDAIELNYYNGKILSSKRTGSVNFEKTYTYDINNGDVLKSVKTKTDKGTAEFAKTDLWGYESGSKMTEDGKLVKQTYGRKDAIVVNDFDKETGIIKQSTVYDKNSKTKKVVQSDALQKAEEIRAKNSTIEGKIVKSETWESGALKKAKFEDGTVKEYNQYGHVIKETRPDGKTSAFIDHVTYEEVKCCSGAYDISKNGGGYALDFFDGHKKYYDDKGVLRMEVLQDGSKKMYSETGALETEFSPVGQKGARKEYYPSGQMKVCSTDDSYIDYNENGTLDSISQYINDNRTTSVSYNEDGITKRHEHFADGSYKEYK